MKMLLLLSFMFFFFKRRKKVFVFKGNTCILLEAVFFLLWVSAGSAS